MADLIVTSSDWQAIRSLAEQGVDYDTLTERYGVSYNSIAMRSHKEQWFTPERVKLKLSRASKLPENGVSGTAQNTPLSANPVSKKDEILETDWNEAATYVRKLSLKTAIRAIEGAQFIECKNGADLKALVHVARQATGVLDTEAPAISLNLGGGGGFFEQAGPVYEAISEPVEPVTLEDCGV